MTDVQDDDRTNVNKHNKSLLDFLIKTLNKVDILIVNLNKNVLSRVS